MRKIFLALALIGISLVAQAQQVHPENSARIYGEISRLDHLVNVLYLAAHPDDENTRLITWLVNDQHVRTAYLSISRGDGGQNLLGSEQGPALGLIRTHELLASRAIDGAGQFFTRGIDFGFSKSSTETLKHWNEKLLTGDVTWIYRKFRPDVVICRFPPTAQAGHGQHSASTIFAEDAFRDSGDKTKYPDQLKYYPVWQPKRILWNTFHFGRFNTTSEDQFKIKVGQYSPLIGMGYGEQAGIIRSMNKTQGAGTPSVPGIATEYFSVLAGEPLKNSLFDGIDITWNRISRKDIGDRIDKVIISYDFLHPEASIPALLEIRSMIRTVKDNYWRNEKLNEINKIILDCSGFLAELVTNRQEVTAGMTLPFTLNIIGRSSIPMTLTSIRWLNVTTNENTKINNDELHTFNHDITLPENTPITEPYWLSQPPVNDAIYSIPADSLLGLAETPDNLVGWVTLNIGGQDFDVKVPLSYKTNDQEKGTLVEQLRVVPDATLDFGGTLLVTRPDGSINTTLVLHPFKDLSGGTLTLSSGTPLLTVNDLDLKAGRDTIININIPAEKLAGLSNNGFMLKADLQSGNKNYNKTLHIISYSHIPTLQYFTPAEVKVLKDDWQCTAKKIGYVPGAGDYMLQFLRTAGFNVDVLNADDFTNISKLNQYDAIVTEVRTLNVEKSMSQWMPVLLQYVHNGGTLVMQYNREYPLATKDFGPYPLTISNERVTEEDAPVTFINPGDSLLNYPNKITEADFRDWVQERGLNFISHWDSRYVPVFRMNDTGESPLEGATLYTTYGKGHYIYTSLSLFRQLPAGNKGAVRLLMNMLSAGK